MKTILRFFFILVPLFILVSCSKNNDCCVIPNPPPPDPFEDLRLDMWPGEDTLLRIPGDLSAYTVSSDMEEVAVAEVAEDGILITASKPGRTSVHIDGGADWRVTLSVNSMMIAGDWESMAGDATYKNSIVVEAEDALFAQEVREELMEELQEEATDLLGYRFRPFVNASTGQLDSATFIKVIHATPLESLQRGSYSFGELTLTLNPANGQEEVYRLLPYQNRMILGLLQDLTARYQVRYPEQSIRQVTVTRHLKYRLPPG